MKIVPVTRWLVMAIAPDGTFRDVRLEIEEEDAIVAAQSARYLFPSDHRVIAFRVDEFIGFTEAG